MSPKCYLFYFFCLVSLETLSQTNKVSGYNQLFDRASKVNYRISTTHVDSLIAVILNKKNRYELIVPLQFNQPNGDTVVHFFYSMVLKKHRSKQVRWINDTSELSNKSFFSIPKNEIVIRPIDYDSVATVMRNNILINSATFNFDRFANENISTFCCNFKSRKDLLMLLYGFFSHGIILSEDPHTNSLYYLAY